MSNLYILLLIGGGLGWLVTALLPTHKDHDALLNIMIGAATGFAAGLFANGGTLYTGLSVISVLACIGAALGGIGLRLIAQRR